MGRDGSTFRERRTSNEDQGSDEEVSPQWLRHLIVQAVEARDAAAAAGNYAAAERIQEEIEDLIEQYEDATGMTVTESGEEVPIASPGIVDSFTETNREVLERRGVPTESISKADAEEEADVWRAVDQAEKAAERDEVERIQVERVTGVDTSRLTSDEVADIVEANRDKFAAETVKANDNWRDYKDRLTEEIQDELDGTPGYTKIPAHIADRATFLDPDDPRNPENAGSRPPESSIPVQSIPGDWPTAPSTPGLPGRELPELPDQGEQNQDPMSPRSALDGRRLPGGSGTTPTSGGSSDSGSTGGSGMGGSATAGIDPPSTLPATSSSPTGGAASGDSAARTGTDAPSGPPAGSTRYSNATRDAAGNPMAAETGYRDDNGQWYNSDGSAMEAEKAERMEKSYQDGSAHVVSATDASDDSGETEDTSTETDATDDEAGVEYTPSGETPSGAGQTPSGTAVREHAAFVGSILEAARAGSEINPTRGDSTERGGDISKVDDLRPVDPPDDYVAPGEPAPPGTNYGDSHGAGTIRPGPDADTGPMEQGPYEDIPTAVGPDEGPINSPVGTNDTGETEPQPTGVARAILVSLETLKPQMSSVAEVNLVSSGKPLPMSALGPTQAEWEAQQAAAAEAAAQEPEPAPIPVPYSPTTRRGDVEEEDDQASRVDETDDSREGDRWAND